MWMHWRQVCTTSTHLQDSSRATVLSPLGLVVGEWGRQTTHNCSRFVGSALCLHASTDTCPSSMSAVMYHAQHGTKLVLVWPPTRENLERLGTSLLTGPDHRPLDAFEPFTGGAAHILRPGERLIIAPLAIHLVVNLTPALSVGTNFNCPTAVTLLSHLNSAIEPALRETAWYKQLLTQMLGIGLELKTPSHLGIRLRAFEQYLTQPGKDNIPTSRSCR